MTRYTDTAGWVWGSTFSVGAATLVWTDWLTDIGAVVAILVGLATLVERIYAIRLRRKQLDKD